MNADTQTSVQRAAAEAYAGMERKERENGESYYTGPNGEPGIVITESTPTLVGEHVCAGKRRTADGWETIDPETPTERE